LKQKNKNLSVPNAGEPLHNNTDANEVTQEQVYDAYTEGTVDATIDNLAGKDVKIPRENYDTMFKNTQDDNENDEFPYPSPS
jgi:hypothetical protein